MAPLDGLQPISDVGGEPLSVGLFLFATDEIQLVDTNGSAYEEDSSFCSNAVPFHWLHDSSRTWL